MNFEEKGLGLRPSEADPRDFVYSVTYGATLPESFQLDISKIKVHDQGKYQNCGTHALSALVEIVLGCEPISFPWYYGNRRYSEHKGQGTEARGLLKAAQKDGGLYFEKYPFEAEVSEVIETFEKKYSQFSDEAKKIRIKNYYQCLTADAVKEALVKGFPVLVGTIVFKSFYEITKDNPVMPEPRISGHSLEEMAGGHMMLIVGYDKRGFKVLNSWGEAFGDNGTFTMPYSIVDWSQRNGFPMPMFEAWAVDGVLTDGQEVKKEETSDGWYKQNGKWRYREKDKDVTGWKKVDGIWYYLKSDGYMATGWIKYEDEWYFLKDNGAMATNWVKTGGRWYYFRNSGEAVKGFQVIDGKKYYFAEYSFESVKECQLIITDEDGVIIAE